MAKNDAPVPAVPTVEEAEELINHAVWYHAWLRLSENVNLDFYLANIEQALSSGMTPDDIYRRISREGGEDASRVAIQCRNAARWIVLQNKE